jgi:hypothetical protein
VGENTIVGILKRDGPCLSGELGRKLEAFGLTPEAARKRVSRGASGVRRLSGLIFPKSVRFLYHESDYNKERYWHALADSVTIASPAYGPALAALQARDGVVPLAYFGIISGSPIRQSGQISSETILERLEAVDLVRRTHVDGVGTCVALSAKGYLGVPNYAALRARLVVENMLLLAVRDWARKLGMASFDKISIRTVDDTLPRYGTFNWDLCGPSYLAPMTRTDRSGKLIPGFLVCDVVVGAVVETEAIAAFVRKCKLSAALRNLPSVMPMLVADRFSPEALRLGKSNGFVMATPYTLFGKDVAIGLATLLQTLNKAAGIAVTKPEVIGELFDRLGQIEGAAGNLRGALFELIVAHSVHLEGGGSIDIGRRLHWADGSNDFNSEIDVMRVKPSEVRVFECKGYQPNHLVDIDEVKRWIEEKVPGIYTWLRLEERFQTRDVHFEFWTTGGFTKAAVDYFESVRQRLRRYHVHYVSGGGVRAYVAKQNASGLIKTLDEHYLNHPISKFDTKHNGAAALNAVKQGFEIEIGGLDEVDETLPFVNVSLAPAIGSLGNG